MGTNRESWPAWAKVLATFRTEPDAGVGDTAKALIDKMGGAAYKVLAKKLGVPCRCHDRQGQWNKDYPYGTG